MKTLPNYLLIVILIFLQSKAYAQKISQESIGEFMFSGSLKLTTVCDNVVKELADNIELFPYPMAWIPGKDLELNSMKSYEVTGSYMLTNDEKSIYMVLMIPDNLTNMNIRVDKIEGKTLTGELLIPEFMFYDPANPPKLPPPTYVNITVKDSEFKDSFTIENMKGNWKIEENSGDDLFRDFKFTIDTEGNISATSKGEEMYMTWKLSPQGSYIYLEPGDYSERIIGKRIDDKTIEAYSDVSLNKFLLRRID
jgi:hypothetical protein